MINNVKVKYILDTNVLINFSLWKPISFNFNNFFWSQLGRSLEEGRWVLLDVVVGEIKYDNDLIKWCKEQKNKNLVDKLKDDEKNRAIEINNMYEMIDQSTHKSEVDTFLIAHAEANGLGVFSREAPKKPSDSLYKIPDVCKILGLTQIYKPRDFFKEIGLN